MANKSFAFGMVTVAGIMIYSGLKGLSIVDTLAGASGAVLNPQGGTASKILQNVGGIQNLPGGTGFNIHTAALEAHQMGLKVDQFGPSIGKKFPDGDTGVTAVHVNGSCHYKGKAFDAVGTNLQMNDFANAMQVEHQKDLSELIHNPLFSIKDGKQVDPSFWGAGVWADHKNHVHVAVGC